MTGADALVVPALQAEPPLGVDVPAEEEVEDDPGIRKEQEDADPREGHGRVPALDEDDREDDEEVEDQEGRLDEAEGVDQRLLDQVGEDDGQGGPCSLLDTWSESVCARYRAGR